MTRREARNTRPHGTPSLPGVDQGETSLPVMGNGTTGSDIQVVGRCGEIFRLLSPARTSLRAGDLEAELGMQRSTAHRYLSSLAGVGFLERIDDGTYVPGPLLVQVGTIALDSRRVIDVADPYLRRLASEVHETTVLSLWGGLGPIVARVVEDMEKVIHIQVRIGTTLAADSAQGKIFLAFLDDRMTVSRALTHLPAPLARDLEDEFSQIRALALAVSTGIASGVRTIAAPVLDRRNRITATMGVVGTMNSVPEDLSSGLAQALAQAAHGLSQQLGWGGSFDTPDP